jgi:hypothetical protein
MVLHKIDENRILEALTTIIQKNKSGLIHVFAAMQLYEMEQNPTIAPIIEALADATLLLPDEIPKSMRERKLELVCDYAAEMLETIETTESLDALKQWQSSHPDNYQHWQKIKQLREEGYRKKMIDRWGEGYFDRSSSENNSDD